MNEGAGVEQNLSPRFEDMICGLAGDLWAEDEGAIYRLQDLFTGMHYCSSYVSRHLRAQGAE